MVLLRSTPVIPDSSFLPKEKKGLGVINREQEVNEMMMKFWSAQVVIFSGSDIEKDVLVYFKENFERSLNRLRAMKITQNEFDTFVASHRKQPIIISPDGSPVILTYPRYNLVPLSYRLWSSIYNGSPLLIAVCDKIVHFAVQSLINMRVGCNNEIFTPDPEGVKINWYQHFSIEEQKLLANVILAAYFWAKTVDEKVQTLPVEIAKKYPSLLAKFDQIESALYTKASTFPVIHYEQSGDFQSIHEFAEFINEDHDVEEVSLYMFAHNINPKEFSENQQSYFRMLLVEKRIRAFNGEGHYETCVAIGNIVEDFHYELPDMMFV